MTPNTYKRSRQTEPPWSETINCLLVCVAQKCKTQLFVQPPLNQSLCIPQRIFLVNNKDAKLSSKMHSMTRVKRSRYEQHIWFPWHRYSKSILFKTSGKIMTHRNLLLLNFGFGIFWRRKKKRRRLSVSNKSEFSWTLGRWKSRQQTRLTQKKNIQQTFVTLDHLTEHMLFG